MFPSSQDGPGHLAGRPARLRRGSTAPSGASYANNFSLPATDSSRALDILKANFPTQAGDSEQIVVQAKQGTLDDPATKAEVTAMLDRVADVPHVRAVISPYGPGGQISKDGTIGLATVYLDALAQNVPKDAGEPADRHRQIRRQLGPQCPAGR